MALPSISSSSNPYELPKGPPRLSEFDSEQRLGCTFSPMPKLKINAASLHGAHVDVRLREVATDVIVKGAICKTGQSLTAKPDGIILTNLRLAHSLSSVESEFYFQISINGIEYNSNKFTIQIKNSRAQKVQNSIGDIPYYWDRDNSYWS